MSKAFTREDDTAGGEVVRREIVPTKTYLTVEGAERLRRELADRQRRRAEVRDVNGHATTELNVIDRRIAELKQSLAFAEVVQTNGDDDVVRFGAIVTVRSEADGEETQYRIVGPAEADVDRGWISSVSPLARALLKRKVGERVAFRYPAGEDTLDIVAVSYGKD